MNSGQNTGAAPEGVRKAAILLVLLGEDVAGTIYRNLPEKDLEQLTDQIARLDYISPQSALSVLEEYEKLSLTRDYVASGGTDYAHRLLVKAFGEDGAKDLLAQVARSEQMSTTKLESLQRFDLQQLVRFMEKENP